MQKSGRQDPFGEFLAEVGERLRSDRWEPAIDVFETEKSVVVRVELAGVSRSDLEVSVDGDVLRVRGVRRAPEESDVQQLHRMEIAMGPFEAAVEIPAPFQRDAIAAHLADGVLRVTLPKRAPQARRIPVER